MPKNSYLSRLWKAVSHHSAPRAETAFSKSPVPSSKAPRYPVIHPLFPLEFPPICLSVADRIALTTSCRDADALPRVADAGQVYEDPQSGARIQIMHNGLRVLADGYYGGWMTDLITRLKGVHEPQEELVFHSLLPHIPEKAVMLEVGAFWSYYTLWFLREHPGLRRGIGIEMDPHHIEVGHHNAALNDLSLTLLQGRIGAENAPPAKYDTESSGRQTMPTYSLEGVMQEADIDRIDLLLCDAQGGEIDLLAGMQGAVDAGKVGVLVMSTHHLHITGDPLTHQRALAMIRTLGGVVHLEHDVAESFSGDGLIVADFDGTLEGWTPPEISRCGASASLFRDTLYDLAEARGITG